MNVFNSILLYLRAYAILQPTLHHRQVLPPTLGHSLVALLLRMHLTLLVSILRMISLHQLRQSPSVMVACGVNSTHRTRRIPSSPSNGAAAGRYS